MKRARALYLNGSKWADLGPVPDTRWLAAIAAVMFWVCGG